MTINDSVDTLFDDVSALATQDHVQVNGSDAEAHSAGQARRSELVGAVRYLHPRLLVGSLMAMDSNTSNRIRETAHDLIAERGYFGFSYADIADVVGIRKASIHHHFPSKVDLVVKTLRDYRSTLVDASTSLDGAGVDPLERIERYVQFWAECINSNRRPICIAALLSAEFPALPEPVKAEVQTHFKYLVSWIKATLDEGARSGRLHLEHSAEIEAQSFVALVHGAMISARTFGSPALFHSVTNGALKSLRIST